MPDGVRADSICSALLALTYSHRLSAFRPLPGGGERQICHDRPCALSRSAKVSAPAPPDRDGVLPEALYRLSLFTPPDLILRLGDRAEVRDGSGRRLRGRVSDSFWYPSHCVAVVEVREAAPEEDAGEDRSQNAEGGGAS